MIGISNLIEYFKPKRNYQLNGTPIEDLDLDLDLDLDFKKSKDRNGNVYHDKVHHEHLHQYVGVCFNEIDG